MKEKTLYVAPECDEVPVTLEGVIAASDITLGCTDPFGDTEMW